MSPLVLSLLAAFSVSAISLIGIVLMRAEWSERLEVTSLSFAAGVLLATTFLDLLPEAVAISQHDGNVFIATLAAMMIFFMLERAVRGVHAHPDSHAASSAYLILIGDGVHNFIDGVAIAAAFMVSPSLGLATTLAVAAHEIPHELADYGVLVSGKFSRRAAVGLNFLSGLTAVLGALVCFGFSGFVERHLGWSLAATAGMFIYIAAADLIPELHHSRWGNSWHTTAPLFAGIVLMAFLISIVPHAR